MIISVVRYEVLWVIMYKINVIFILVGRYTREISTHNKTLMVSFLKSFNDTTNLSTINLKLLKFYNTRHICF